MARVIMVVRNKRSANYSKVNSPLVGSIERPFDGDIANEMIQCHAICMFFAELKEANFSICFKLFSYFVFQQLMDSILKKSG